MIHAYISIPAYFTDLFPGYTLPDQTFHTFRTSKSKSRRTLSNSKMSFAGLQGSEIVKCSVVSSAWESVLDPISCKETDRNMCTIYCASETGRRKKRNLVQCQCENLELNSTAAKIKAAGCFPFPKFKYHQDI